MKTFAIYEENLDRLTKQINRIKNKCIKYRQSFTFTEVGEEFQDITTQNGEVVTLRFVLVQVDGQIEHHDWKFVGTIAHEEAGNIIRQLNTQFLVPTKYYTSKPTCDHCKTQRRRKDTYLIINEVTGEWKQVGKTCLNEFTNGMNAEDVASYISLFNSLIQGASPSSGSSFKQYHSVAQVLSYAFETVKYFGYQRATEWEARPTRSRCMDYADLCNGRSRYMSNGQIRALQKEMDSVGFDGDSATNQKLAWDAIQWALNNEDESNSYLHNLKVICSSEYTESRNLGMLISLAATYNRVLGTLEEKKKQESEQEIEVKVSEFLGAEKDKVLVTLVSGRCLYSNDTIYGTMYMYKFVDDQGNVIMWSTGNAVDLDNIEGATISGSIKKLETYHGVKQTWLTRCKVTVNA